MKKYSLLLSIIASSLILSACAGAKGERFTTMAQPTKGYAKLYVYRPNHFIGGGVRYSVHAVDAQNKDTVIGFLRNGGFIDADLPAGKYELWAKTESKESIMVTLLENQITCVKSGVGAGVFIGRPHFDNVTLEQCQRDIAQTRESYRHKSTATTDTPKSVSTTTTDVQNSNSNMNKATPITPVQDNGERVLIPIN